jgi:TPR repeat protein
MRKSLALALISAALVAALPAAAQILSPDDAAALFSQARDAFQKQDYKTAMEKLQPAAEAGSTEAEAMLAQAYVTGNQGLPQDYAKALMWNEKAATSGSARAYLNLAMMYRDGTGVAKDETKAMQDFTKAADMGDMKAPRYLGLYAAHAGDFAKAFSFYQEGASRGDITSQFYLGHAYELGQGVGQDYAQAQTWYTKSAERGDHVASDGMVGLAGLYERGLGVAQDLDKAIALFEQAAATGNEDAQKALQRLGMK